MSKAWLTDQPAAETSLEEFAMITTYEKARLVLEAPISPDRDTMIDSAPQAALTLIPMQAPVPVSSSLRFRQQTTCAIAERCGFAIQPLGFAYTFEGVQIFEGPSSDWALTNLTGDPLYYHYGERLMMPKTVFGQLEGFVAHGLDFDALFVAHELPKGVAQPEQPLLLDYLIPPPPEDKLHRIQRADQWVTRFCQGIEFGTRLALGAATVPLVIGGLALGTAAAIAGGLAVGLDPILFGLHLDRASYQTGPYPASWYYLAQWTW